MAKQASRYLGVAVFAILAGCTEHDSDKYIRYEDELGSRYEGGDSLRMVDLEQSSADRSCLRNGQTMVRGNVTHQEIEDLVAVAQNKWPDEPVKSIEVSPRVAKIKTGIDCHGAGSGFGHTLFFEPNGTPENRWRITLESSWIG
jgi:hypothetical protein